MAVDSAIPVSVVVASRGRPDLLVRCLTGLGQLFHEAFEIVVVADPAGMRAVTDMGWRTRVKLVAFDEANISAARNAGIGVAAGEIVAFIDDDAVPEPSWLDHLSAVFDDPQIIAAGGYVRGRNGISYQYHGALVTLAGEDIALEMSGDAPFIPDPPDGHAVKTMGTNCAFRRKDVALIGGLDPVFRFFHDETDLNMRLRKGSGRTAIVPLAQVHHGYAPSVRRGADRAPLSLFEVGASSMVFLRKHAPEGEHESALSRLRDEQRKRLLRHMVGGGLEPRDVERVMDSLDAGIAEGLRRPLSPLVPISMETAPFLPFQKAQASRGSVCIGGRSWSRRRLHRQALAHVEAGEVVSVFRFSPTALYHDVRFTKDGYWLQRGGLFGRANRTESVIKLTSFSARLSQEWQRVAGLRQGSGISMPRGDEEG